MHIQNKQLDLYSVLHFFIVLGLKKADRKNMSYSSTSHYMRQTLGMEKPRKSIDAPGKRYNIEAI